MVPSKGESESDLFKSVPLLDAKRSDSDQIDCFTPVHPNGKNLVDYVKSQAWKDESNNQMRTYLVEDCQTDELVGFFSLKAGLISYNEKVEGKNATFETLPGVELANYAMNATYRDAHPDAKGCGLIVFQRLVMPIVRSVASQIGVQCLYLFSLPDVTEVYESYGFSRLPKNEEDLLHQRLKPRYDASCIFMFMTL